MFKASCHCGQVRITIPRLPSYRNDCNCSICRRYGVLWGYFSPEEVHIEAAPNATDEYSWGDKDLRFVRCSNCGCVICWQGVVPQPDDKVGVNTRMFDPSIMDPVPIKHSDGASQ